MVAHAAVPFVGGVLAKRFYQDDEPISDPVSISAILIILASFLVFLPVITFIGYTLTSLVLSLAMVEDPNPPAYEPLATTEDAEPTASDLAATGKPTTSSVRATLRLLRSVGGFRGLFRGIIPAAAWVFAATTLSYIISSFHIPAIFGKLIASLALVQLSTAWVHIIMTAPNPLPFYRRLPPLRKTFEATCFPVLANWVAMVAVTPEFTASLLGLPVWNTSHPLEFPEYGREDTWKFVVFFVINLAINLLLVVPSTVVLVRVQASLLPPDEQTIVPFDSTFRGKVGPAVVDGKGFVTMRDAPTTFSRASWIRLYKLYAKVFAITFAAFFLFFLVIFAEAFAFGLRK